MKGYCQLKLNGLEVYTFQMIAWEEIVILKFMVYYILFRLVSWNLDADWSLSPLLYLFIAGFECGN